MNLQAAFDLQSAACSALGSPFTGRLMALAGQRLRPGTPVADRLLAWPGDVSAHGDSVPLRLAGALHALVLREADAGLVAAWPPNDADGETIWASIEAAFTAHENDLMQWLNSPPQTNEVRRCAAMIPVGHLLAARYNLPLRLSELGASAGLNLHWDAFALDVPGGVLGPDDAVIHLAPDWTGSAPLHSTPVIADRRGIDLNPVSPASKTDRLRLRAYTWPDQTDRMARLDAALEIAEPVVDKGDAANWITQRLAEPISGQTDFVFNTIAWQYFPKATQEACRQAIERRGAMARTDAPLAWLSVESDGETKGAAMTLRLWPGDTEITLGRMDFHGRWIDWFA